MYSTCICLFVLTYDIRQCCSDAVTHGAAGELQVVQVMSGQKAADLLGDADTGVTSSKTDAVDCRMLSQEVSNLRSLA